MKYVKLGKPEKTWNGKASFDGLMYSSNQYAAIFMPKMKITYLNIIIVKLITIWFILKMHVLISNRGQLCYMHKIKIIWFWSYEMAWSARPTNAKAVCLHSFLYILFCAITLSCYKKRHKSLTCFVCYELNSNIQSLFLNMW